MKLTCNCGTEIVFKPTGVVDDSLGKEVKYDQTKFRIDYHSSDEKYIQCLNCKDKVWFY